MAYQPETATYDAGVYQLETTDPVAGGVGGVANAPLLNLANRTAYLKLHVDNLESGATIPPTVAPLNSPTFTGSPSGPTPPAGDNSTKFATTAWANNLKAGLQTINVAGGANVVLNATQYGAGVLILTGALTANIQVILPAQAGRWLVSNQTSGAFSITMKTAGGTGVSVAQLQALTVWGDGTNIYREVTDFTSIALAGTPTAPTPPAGDNSTRVANTAALFQATDGIAAVNVAGNSNVVLTAAQYGLAILNLTGALTGSINLVFPNTSGQWVVANNSTGAFNITAKTAAGTGVVLPQGSAVIVYGDGTNIYAASSAGQTSLSRFSFAPVAGTTSLAITGGFTPGNVLVSRNGSMLEPTSDFSDATSPTITLTTASVAGDTFDVWVFSSFSVANAVQKSGDTMAGALALAAGSTAPAGTSGNQLVNFAQFLASTSANGYQKLPSGVIVQWGSIGGVTTTSTSANFPIAFTTAVNTVLLTVSGAPAVAASLANVTLSALSAVVASGNYAVGYIAIGY